MRKHVHLRFIDAIPIKLHRRTAMSESTAKTKTKAKRKAKPKSDAQPSVREWLSAQLEKRGEIDVAAAKEWVASTGRSPTTLYRQAGELKLKLDRRAGAWRAK